MRSMKFLIISTFVTLSMVVVLEGAAKYSNQGDPVSLSLALFWPNGQCGRPSQSHKCVKSIPQKFTIHGIWPRVEGGKTKRGGYTRTKNSPDVPLLESDWHEKLDPSLKDDLLEFWPSLDASREARALWENEWFTHGVVAPSRYPDIQSYIREAVSVYKELKLHKLMENLMNAGIKQEVAYDPSEIADKIKSIIHFLPTIHCSDESGRLKIDRIEICISLHDGTVEDCANGYQNCGKTATFEKGKEDVEKTNYGQLWIKILAGLLLVSVVYWIGNRCLKRPRIGPRGPRDGTHNYMFIRPSGRVRPFRHFNMRRASIASKEEEKEEERQ